MASAPSNPIGLFTTPVRRVEPTLLQPRRFPEYLRLQNVRDRVADIAELTSGAPVSATPEPGHRDASLARIGDVLPIEQGSAPSVQACPRPCPPAGQSAIDGLGRMIDLLA